jgi:hypothetical protein
MKMSPIKMNVIHQHPLYPSIEQSGNHPDGKSVFRRKKSAREISFRDPHQITDGVPVEDDLEADEKVFSDEGHQRVVVTKGGEVDCRVT